MSFFKSRVTTRTDVNTDELLHDSYLLVTELRQGGLARSNHELWNLCASHVETVRARLKDAGFDARRIDDISHAQCALLDETVFTCAEETAKEKWATEPLQVRFFNRHQAGEFLYEEMRAALRAPAPDTQVLRVYQRVLTLGFLGRYAHQDDPERQALLEALNDKVPPLPVVLAVNKKFVGKRRSDTLHWLRSPVAHGVLAMVLLIGLWWGLDHHLAELLASIAPVQEPA